MQFVLQKKINSQTILQIGVRLIFAPYFHKKQKSSLYKRSTSQFTTSIT